MFRLQKKHSGKQADTGPKPDVALILAQQSIGRAVAGGIALVLVFGWIWAVLSMRTGRVFPWISILIGIFSLTCCTGAGHGEYGQEGKQVDAAQSLHAGLLVAMKSLPATQYVSENIPLGERPFRDAGNKLLPCRLWR